ncbi:transposase [Variovorax humicola]|uniref:Transposase n=1 Tax=Variovorax humicola TaxID=1769758 RepID=A0ABU8WAX6_9BURK
MHEQETRRNHSAAFKANVAIEALADGKTIAEVALKHDVHPNQVTEWRRQLIERAAGVFGGATPPESPPVNLKVLHAKIGQLTLEKRTIFWEARSARPDCWG